MRVAYVHRPDYKIAFTADDPLNPELEIEYRPPRGVVGRTSAPTPITSRLPSITVYVDVLANETENPELKLPSAGPEIANMHANTKLNDDRDEYTGVHFEHLSVDEDHRREGLGQFLFDVYRAFVIWVGGDASGKIGSYDVTHDFLVKQGVPTADIKEVSGTWSYGPAAAWSTDAENLREGDRNVGVEFVDSV